MYMLCMVCTRALICYSHTYVKVCHIHIICYIHMYYSLQVVKVPSDDSIHLCTIEIIQYILANVSITYLYIDAPSAGDSSLTGIERL